MHYPIWSRSSFSGEVAKVLGIFWMGGGIAFIQKKCGIYTTTHWHLYNTLAFIQQHTGIYTTTHWHLYNNTLAFIQQHTGIYTTTHWHLYNIWHLYTTHWHLYKSCLSSFSPKLFMALCHERHADK